MNYIFISPQFPSNFKFFVERLKNYGVSVFGIASDGYDQLEDALKTSLQEYVQVSNMENYEEVYKAVAFIASKYGRIDRIESHNEHWLELDAKLRTDFNVFGLHNEEIYKIKRKSEMKKVFKKLGLAFAPGQVFNTYEEAIKLAKKLKYPVIVKPDKGVGAAFTYRLFNDEELQIFFQNKPEMPFIMENFIDADIVTYDGLVNTQGEIVFENSLVYDSGVMDNVVYGKDMYYYTVRNIDPKLKVIGEACVAAFNLKERFFHMEFFVTPQKEYIALEVNVRPPGGMTMDMFNYANDHDFFDTYARVVTQQEVQVPSEKPYFVLYVGIKEHNFSKHILNVEEVSARYQNLIVFQGSIASIFAPAIGNYTYILRGTQEAEVLSAAKTILAQKEN